VDTEALIEQLARDTRAVPPGALQRRLALGLGVGALASALLLLGGLGLRPDLHAAIGGTALWAKAAYTSGLGLAGLLLTVQLARPDSERLRFLWLLAIPVALAVLFSGAELAAATSIERDDLLVAPKWTCVPLILMLSAPIYAGLVSALRRLAPTRLGAAGAAAGLTAGGFAATIYCLYCQQVSPTYVLTRYTLAIGLAAAAGAALGPRLLRW
jgi:hypothetical protein